MDLAAAAPDVRTTLWRIVQHIDLLIAATCTTVLFIAGSNFCSRRKDRRRVVWFTPCRDHPFYRSSTGRRRGDCKVARCSTPLWNLSLHQCVKVGGSKVAQRISQTLGQFLENGYQQCALVDIVNGPGRPLQPMLSLAMSISRRFEQLRPLQLQQRARTTCVQCNNTGTGSPVCSCPCTC
jgi:hypothetical protein